MVPGHPELVLVTNFHTILIHKRYDQETDIITKPF